jgi:hypothetical protein
MGNLEQAIAKVNALRNSRSVMNDPPSPEPYIGLPSQEEPGLEAVSPEDYVPSPKSLVAALKSAGPLLAMVGSMKNVGKKKLTEFEQRHLVAQRNAALPVEQGGLGLGPQNTAMERANHPSMFPDEVYHGQRANTPVTEYFAGGLGSMTHDPVPLEPISKIVSGQGRGEGGAFYMSNDLDVGRGYAGKTGAIYPLRINKNDFKTSGYPHDFPVNGTEAEKAAFTRDVEAFNRNLDKTKNRYFRDEVKQVESEGQGGVVFKNVEDSSGSPVYDYPSDVYASIGAPVRSRFAAFDPMRRHEADILGFANPQLLGGMALGSGGILAAPAIVEALREKK